MVKFTFQLFVLLFAILHKCIVILYRGVQGSNKLKIISKRFRVSFELFK